jgi:hypothetical protein
MTIKCVPKRNVQVSAVPKLQNSKFTSFGGAGDFITKRMTSSSSITTTGGGAIGVTTISSGGVQSIPSTEWTRFAAAYQSYRVRGLRVKFIPTHPTVDAVATVHSFLVVGDSLQGNAPSSATQIMSDEASVEFPTHKGKVFICDWSKNPNAKLWNPTTAVIPTANLFQINFASPNVLAVTTKYFDILIEWIVDFRGSQ